MAKDYVVIKGQANIIRNETAEGGNTAAEVGGAIYDVADKLEEVDGILTTAIGTKLPSSSVVDNLASTSAAAPLSANQGRVLNETKADKTTQVVAGNGLTGGGALSADRTINIANADDSLVVAADSVKVNTNNTLTSTSTTQPLSANQGKVLNEKVAQVETDLSVTTDKLTELERKTDNISSELNGITTGFVELLSNNKLSEGYLNYLNGNFVEFPISEGGDAYTTDFLRVKENELLTIHIAHSYNNNVIAMYDEQKGFISAKYTYRLRELEFIIPNNVAYIRYAFLISTLSELSITISNKGITADSLSPQLGGFHEKTNGVIEIYDSAKCGVYEAQYLTSNGGFAPADDACVSHLIQLYGTGDILFNPQATRGFQNSRFIFFDKDMNVLVSDFSKSVRLACPYNARFARFDMSISFQDKEYIRQIAEIEIPSLLNSALNEIGIKNNLTTYLVDTNVASTGVSKVYIMFRNIRKGYTYRITLSSKNALDSISISTTNRINNNLINYIVEENFITFSTEDIANAKTKLWTAKVDALYATAWIPYQTEIAVTVEECDSEIREASRMAELSLETQRIARYRSIMAGFPNSGKMFRVFGSYDLRYWESFGNGFVPSKGSGFTRDPSLGIIGDYYYIVYTDASGWTMPSHTIGMARTLDFKSYEELDILECGTQFNKVWAPCFYMENGKVYIIYAATTTGGADFQVYISEYNTINHSLSEPTKLNIGSLVSAIDYHIHKIDGEYYAVGKDDVLCNTVIAKSPTLIGDYEIVMHKSLTGLAEEGQFAMQLSENRWRIFLNDYSVNYQILFVDVDNITSPQKFSSVGKISYEGEGIDAPLFHPSFIDNNFNEIDYPIMS